MLIGRRSGFDPGQLPSVIRYAEYKLTWIKVTVIETIDSSFGLRRI